MKVWNSGTRHFFGEVSKISQKPEGRGFMFDLKAQVSTIGYFSAEESPDDHFILVDRPFIRVKQNNSSPSKSVILVVKEYKNKDSKKNLKFSLYDGLGQRPSKETDYSKE